MPLYVSDDLMTPETINVFILFAMFLAVGRLSFPVALSAFEYFSVIFFIALCGANPLLASWINKFSASLVFSILRSENNCITCSACDRYFC